jgi:hypothetical protein
MYSYSRHYMEVSTQLHTRAVLPPGKSPQYLLNMRLNGPQSRFRHDDGEVNSPAPAGNRASIFDRPLHSHFTD